MSCTYLVFIWCLLVMSVQIDNTNGQNPETRTDADYHIKTKPFTDFSRLNKSLITRSKSVYMDGKKIELSTWLQDVTTANEQNDVNVITMFTFLKCECAHHIRASANDIYNYLKQCSNTDNIIDSRFDKTKCESVVPVFENLKKNISLAMTTLLLISDQFSKLKRDEPHFLKGLVMAYLYSYSKSKTTMNDIINNVSNEVLKMRRVMSQITTITHGYIIEHCYSSIYDVALFKTPHQNQTVSTLNKELDSFNSFLKAVVPLENFDSPFSLIDMNGFMLSFCFEGKTTKYHSGVARICELIASDSTSNVMKIQLRNLKYGRLNELYEEAIREGDVESVYEFMLATYKLILKLIHEETIKIVNNKKTIKPDDVNKSIGKLKKMDCPIEMINLFEFLLRLQEYRKNETVTKADKKSYETAFIESNVNAMINVELTYDLQDDHISLKEFMEIILDDQFWPFWSVFNFLHRESQLSSNRVYDFTLDLFQGEFYSYFNNNNKEKCNALDKIYINYMKIEKTNNKSFNMIRTNWSSGQLGWIPTIKNAFDKVRSRNTMLSTYLLRVFDDWDKLESIQSDKDLLNIFINAIVHLKNEFNIDIDTEDKKLEELLVILMRKQEKLQRTGDFIMNLLDNYQIRNCKYMRLRHFIYEKEYLGKNEDESLVTIEFPKTVVNRYSDDEVDYNKRHYGLLDSAVGAIIKFTGLNLSDTVPEKTNLTENIPLRFYDLSQLTARDAIVDLWEFGKQVFFVWHGEVKSLQQIQTDISENMLNMLDVVEYQQLYYALVSFVAHNATYFMLDTLVKNVPVLPADIKEWSVMKVLNNSESYHKIRLPEPYNEYAVKASIVNGFYALLKNPDFKNKSDIFKTEILHPISSILGVWQVEDIKLSLPHIKHTFKINAKNTDMADVSTAVFLKICKLLGIIEEEFMFFKHSSQNVQHNTSYYPLPIYNIRSIP